MVVNVRLDGLNVIKARGTWTIVDGSKRVRTGFAESKRDLAVIACPVASNDNEMTKDTAA